MWGEASGQRINESIDRILVPVDFSRSSFEALEYAIEFAEKVAARLIVFHAVHLGYAFSADGYAMCDLSVLIKDVRKGAEQEMQKFVRLAKFRGVKFETIVKIAPPTSEICAFAEECDVDLIITATHGRTGLKHLLMGSVAEQVVRYARQPVLVVPSHPETRTAKLSRSTGGDRQSMARRTRSRTLPALHREADEAKSKTARSSIPRTAPDKQVPRIAFAPGDVKKIIKNVLVPVDFSRMSIQGIEIAKRLGRGSVRRSILRTSNNRLTAPGSWVPQWRGGISGLI